MSPRRTIAAALLIIATWAVAAAVVLNGGDDHAHGSAPPREVRLSPHGASAGPVVNAPPSSRFDVRAALEPTPVRVTLADPPRAGLLFDVDSGRVLWQLNPSRRLPIASLTKMMTGLLIAERHQPKERVLITPQATGYAGSGIGVLPRGQKVPLGPLLRGLMMVSGNDAAIALAQHDAGGQDAFVERMNTRAAALGLSCSRFSNASGIRDEGNYSCPLDLATLARLDLANRWLGRIVGTLHARVPFPIKGGHLDLFNINPFLLSGTPGITGVKTGLTNAAGRCYVITARRGGHHLGVVLLHSPDPLAQVAQLLDAGAKAERR